METEFDEEGEDEESDADDFIVDDDGRPITEKKKKVVCIVSECKFQIIPVLFNCQFSTTTKNPLQIHRRVEFSTMSIYKRVKTYLVLILISMNSKSMAKITSPNRKVKMTTKMKLMVNAKSDRKKRQKRKHQRNPSLKFMSRVN